MMQQIELFRSAYMTVASFCLEGQLKEIQQGVYSGQMIPRIWLVADLCISIPICLDTALNPSLSSTSSVSQAMILLLH
jgi:hypothetical protein